MHRRMLLRSAIFRGSSSSLRCLTSRASSSSPLELIRNSTLVQGDYISTQTSPVPLDQTKVVPFDWTGRDRHLLAGCEPSSSTAPPLRVALLLSGGVDSSTALTLAKAAGHHVEAFYLKIWFQEDFRNFWDACPWEEDLHYCEEICKQFDVPLHVVPLTTEYWDRVVGFSIAEIQKGRTPNPDILCNSKVKFGAFYDWLDQHRGKDFDRIASGHYAAIRREWSQMVQQEEPTTSTIVEDLEKKEDDEGGGNQRRGVVAKLCLTPDKVKDQTYFLAGLTQQQLSRVMFPIGPLTKAQVREVATRARLPNSGRKDSQGICFLGKVKFSEFVKEHLGEWPGAIVEEETNQVVGYHEGNWFYTPGQRKGIKLSGGPWYVTKKDPDLNAVYVSRQTKDGNDDENDDDEETRKKKDDCTETSNDDDDGRMMLNHRTDRNRKTLVHHLQWNSNTVPDFSKKTFVKVRHGPHMYECKVKAYSPPNESVRTKTKRRENHHPFLLPHDDDHVLEMELMNTSDQGLAAGQYAVFYQEDVCLGSGVMQGGRE